MPSLQKPRRLGQPLSGRYDKVQSFGAAPSCGLIAHQPSAGVTPVTDRTCIFRIAFEPSGSCLAGTSSDWLGARMRCSRYILALFMTLVFGLFASLPAEDIPETPYDESETLPYEGAPLLSGDVLQDPARGAQPFSAAGAAPTTRFLSLWNNAPAARTNHPVHPGSDLVTTLECSFRC